MPPHSDPQQLLQTFVDFAQATSWPQAKRVLEQHPELLDDEVDTLLGQLAAAQESKGARDFVEAHRALLQRCRKVGVEVAFAEIERASQPAIPTEFQEDLRCVQEAEQHYQRTGQQNALDAAIGAWERILAHAAFSETSEAFQLYVFNEAGGTYLHRYWAKGELPDLDRSLALWQQALAAAPPDAPERTAILTNLGNGLHDRYARRGQLADLEAALEAYQQAVAATPPDAPERAMFLNNLGAGLRDRYRRRGQFADLEEAQSAYRGACELGLETDLEEALRGARNWGNWALERHVWEEAAEAYDYSAKAVERLLETQLLRSAKEIWLREVQGLAANAAYAVARTGDLKRAVEVVEGGRARLLAEALESNRRDLEQLPTRGHGELLARYRQATDRWKALTVETERPSEAPLPDAAARRGALAEARAELDAVVEAVRQVPGYADFLRAPTFMQIRAAAREAPLVYLMATRAGGLALIVSPVAKDAAVSSASGVQAVWLDALTDAAVREQVRGPDDTPQLGGYLGAYTHWRAEPRNPEARAHWFDTLETTTRWLWDVLMGPLIAALAPAAAPKAPPVPAIVLIPTGLLGLLPLHAAWTEDAAVSTGRRYAVDVAAVRYAPNARALTATHALAETTLTERLLLCVEPQLVSADPLSAAAQEALDILRYWPPGSYTDRWHLTATHKELVMQLPRHTCLHFAGHAFAGWDEPQQGGLLMASNQVLTVRELTGMRLPLRLAILSACETGVPGIRLPADGSGGGGRGGLVLVRCRSQHRAVDGALSPPLAPRGACAARGVTPGTNSASRRGLCPPVLLGGLRLHGPVTLSTGRYLYTRN